ncbi:MAG: hypothetical protein HW421_1498 [Ignavibacteria bacterium]|nr:hypothetical protein [Ignavibacteria bacterium]
MKTPKSKDDDAQIEVWEWKQALYEEVKELDKYEQFNYINNKADIVRKNMIERQKK